MNRQELSRRIHDIVNRLSEITEQDLAVIQPRSAKPVEISLDQLFAYGERYEERERLHEELRALASEKIED